MLKKIAFLFCLSISNIYAQDEGVIQNQNENKVETTKKSVPYVRKETCPETCKCNPCNCVDCKCGAEESK